MNKTITNALQHLENAEYGSFFSEIDKVIEEMPSELKEIYHRHKQKFLFEGINLDLTQQLKVFAELIHPTIISNEEDSDWSLQPADQELIKSRNFNSIFIEKFMEAIQPYNALAKKIIDYVQKAKIADWASQEKYAVKAREILTKNFSNVIGVQINHLIAIGRNDKISVEEKINPYIEKCLFIAQYALDLVSFAFISKLWDLQETSSLTFNSEQQTALLKFFDRSFEAEFVEKIDFLKTLYPLFGTSDLPFPEMKDFESNFEINSPLYQSCLKLQKLKNIAPEKYNFQKCLLAEIELSTVMSHFSFLIQYKMISIKNVNFKYLRNTEPHFIHHYIELGFDQKANKDVEKHRYTTKNIDTDTVLIYQGEAYDENSLNLFPFVIDFNALNMQDGQLICFFQSVNFTDENILEYAILKDDSIKEIEFQDIQKQQPNWDELVGKKDNLKALNLDHTILQFREAKAKLTSQQIEKDDEFEALFN